LSDLDLVAALDAMELLLQGGALEPEVVAAWQERFDTALASADRGPGWASLVTRAHALATRVDAAALPLAEQRDQMRKELALQAQGVRALRGYRPT